MFRNPEDKINELMWLHGLDRDEAEIFALLKPPPGRATQYRLTGGDMDVAQELNRELVGALVEVVA